MGNGNGNGIMANRVLFVHGAAGDARIWEPVIARLPADITGEALTLTYFGPGDWPDDGRNFSTELHCADILRAARKAGGPVHLVCWSYAVHVGLAALLAEPHLFASALFYEGARPHYIADKAQLREFGTSAETIFGPLAKALEQDGPEATIPALFGAHYANMPAQRRDIYLSNARMMPLLFHGAPPAKITPAELARISVPCCGAIGSETPPAFAISTRALAEAIPGAAVTMVEGADHFLPETGPDRFAALVADWIGSLRPG